MKRLFKALTAFAAAALIVFFLLYFLLYGLEAFQIRLISGTLLTMLQSLFTVPVIFDFSLACGAFAFSSVLFERIRLLRNAATIAFIGVCAYGFIQQLPETTAAYTASIYEHAREDYVNEANEDIVRDNAETYYYEGLPLIQVISDDYYPAERIDYLVANTIAVQPEYLLEKCSSIIFLDEANFENEPDIVHLGSTVGLASSKDMTIRILIQDFDGPFIDSSMPEVVMQPDDYYVNTISHELSHLYDYQYAYSQEFLTDDPRFEALYEADPYLLGEYAGTSVHEYFAEASKYYHLYPNMLIDKSYSLYVYMDHLYNG